MKTPDSLVLPACGKIIELQTLDRFIWATLHGWGVLKELDGFTDVVQPPGKAEDPGSQAKGLKERLKQEEGGLRLTSFTDDQAKKDYPYLFALVSVRLWAMAEAAARETLVEAIKKPSGPPERSKLGKVRGPIGQIVGADPNTQMDLVADALWQSPEGRFRGIERFDAVLELIGLGGSPPSPVNDILLELSEIRHCVVHRGGLMDRRFLEACPWIQMNPGSLLPTSLKRYWFHRTATYWYILDLVRRWARWQSMPDIGQVVDQMDAVVLGELKPEWAADKRLNAH